MYKPWIYNYLLLALLVPINMVGQKESKLIQIKNDLTAQAIHFKDCVLGNTKCNQAEISNARWNLGLITAVLGLIATTGAYYKGVGPFKHKKIIRDTTKLAEDTQKVIKNPDPKKQQEIQKELRDVINEVKKSLPEDLQNEIQIIQEKMQEPAAVPVPPITTDPTEQIQQQLVLLQSNLRIYLQNATMETFNALKDMYAKYLSTIVTHKNMNIDAIVNRPIIGNSAITGKVLVNNVQNVLKNSVVFGRQINPYITAYNDNLANYVKDQSDDNLLALHFAALDIEKRIAPMRLENFLSIIQPTEEGEKPSLDEIKKTHERFLQLMIKRPEDLKKLKQYPGYDHVTKKYFEKELRKKKKK